jgi:thiamine-phosphate pyrophosphorylase
MNPLTILPSHGLYLLTPDEPDTRRLVAQVEPLLAEGVAMLQLRNKLADAALRRIQALALLPICRAHQVPLIINDDWRLAGDIGADGAHLGEHDGEMREARAELGDAAILGASCYADIARAQQAKAAGASYLAFGAIFESGSKPLAGRASLTVLGEATRLGMPTVAIGGITPDNTRQVIAAGADFVAVIGAVFAAPNPVAAVRAFRLCFP